MGDVTALTLMSAIAADARDVAWTNLLRANDKFRLGGVPDFVTRTLRLPNGDKVVIRETREDVLASGYVLELVHAEADNPTVEE